MAFRCSYALIGLFFIFGASHVAKAGASFGFSSSAGVFAIRSSDLTGGGVLNLATPSYGYSWELSWCQYWGGSWETDLKYGQRNMVLTGPSNIAVTNLNQIQLYYNFGFGKQLGSLIKVLLEGAYANYGVVQPTGNASATIATAKWFSAGMAGVFTVLQTSGTNGKFSMSLKGSGHAIIPADSSYPLGLSNIDFSYGLAMAYDRKKWGLELGAFYFDQLLESSSIRQSLSAVGISLGFSFKIGNTPKFNGNRSTTIRDWGAIPGGVSWGN